ncbi:hypothetical protein ACIP98_04680 [Streptomyces sp. NPDC088354]|uniref:hypothetical protein n=1 Tax=unclassified Streptomyces TaxID=2593676 RepID=UPI0029B00604|nr:hypothetical protein [Streptomyces sp. MI02-7b]MDX3071997.1 hypothetical protein [Streptomyces sp. MI02-7b]
MRRSVAATAAVVLVLEAFGFAVVNWVMGIAVEHQQMSLGGLKPSAMAAGAWAAGVVMALFLIGCAIVLARAAVRDRAPGRLGRILLIVCAVTHGVLAAGLAAPVGWAAFVGMVVIMGLVVLSLLLYAGGEAPAAPAADQPGGSTPPPPPVAPAAV